jgi:hypothetical protein
VGAGPSFNFIHQGLERREIDFGNFEFETGLNVFTGVRFRRGTFVEVKTNLWAHSIPALRLIFGFDACPAQVRWATEFFRSSPPHSTTILVASNEHAEILVDALAVVDKPTVGEHSFRCNPDVVAHSPVQCC